MARLIGNAPETQGEFKNYERSEAGTYLCELTGIEDYLADVYKDKAKVLNADGSVQQAENLRFVFKALKGLTDTEETLGTENTVKVSPNNSSGEPFEFRKQRVRAIKYGNENANITQLIDILAGRGDKKAPAIAASERPFGIDIDGFIGNKYRITVDKTEDQNTPGRFYNAVLNIGVHKAALPDLTKVLPNKSVAAAAAPVKPNLEDNDIDPFA